jgi:PQQ-like domain
VIELGELPREEPLLPPAPVRLTRRLVRQIVLSAVAVLTLCTVTGSIVPVRHEVHRLWSTPYGEGDAMIVEGGTLYLSRGSVGQQHLTAFDLPTGRVRWSTPADAGSGVVEVLDRVLIEAASTGDVEIPQPDGSILHSTQVDSTMVRDADTGRELWRHPGDALRVYTTSVLLGESNSQGKLIRLTVVGLRDGVTRWTRAVHAVDGWDVAATGEQPTEIVLADPSGVLTVLDYADGRTGRTGKVRWLAQQQPDDGISTSLTVIGDYLVVTLSTNTAQASTVYRRSTFQKLWHANGFVLDCGPVLCTSDDRSVVGRDPVTGQVRWSAPGMGTVWYVGDGRLLADAPTTAGPHQIIDAVSGRRIGDAVRGDATWVYFPVPPAVVVLGSAPGRPGLNTVIRLDLRNGSRSLLGTIQQAEYSGCQAVPGYLTCVRPDKIDIIAVG